MAATTQRPQPMAHELKMADIRGALQLAQAQAAELWRQAERISAAYRAAKEHIDELQAELTEHDVRVPLGQEG